MTASPAIPTKLTVKEVIRRAMPDGSQAVPLTTASSPTVNATTLPPDFPPDLFGVAAYLLVSAGAYHYFVPPGSSGNWLKRCVQLKEHEVQAWRATGKDWAKKPSVPTMVEWHWAELMRLSESSVFMEPRRNDAPPEWWMHAMALVVISDEACSDIGYVVTDDSPRAMSWIAKLAFIPYRLVLNKCMDGNPHGKLRLTTSSLCVKVDNDVVCVQPKSRTPQVGCTMRTLTHNLSLLPRRGEARVIWHNPSPQLLSEDAASLNLLLVPYPYRIDDGWFRPKQESGGILGPRGAQAEPWGWFDIEQRWLNDEIVQFTQELILKARSTVGPIHGVIFPEYALDWQRYSDIVDVLRTSSRHDVEFLLSGAGQNCDLVQGNFVLSTQFFEQPSPDGSVRVAVTASRPKHHRWRLDLSQQDTYNLNFQQRGFNGNFWERTALPMRELHVNVFRRASIFSTLICEDLARSEPCHEVLRAIGPNLVFVLLMDSAQLLSRWPGRYATGLAEDPGSSVVTLTSLGLIRRANEVRLIEGKTPAYSIGLFKDDTGRIEHLDCEGAHGIVISLDSHAVNELTYDGRSNDEARAWRFLGQHKICLDGQGNSRVKRLIDAVVGPETD